MTVKNVFVLAGLVFFLSGCATGQMFKNSFQGNRYLDNKDYRQGELVFRDAVAQDPGAPLANYYLGRFLLAQDKPQQALPYLQKAASLEQSNTDYLFWQGRAQGVLGDMRMEHASYLKVLQINAKHVPALTSLGHNQFKQKEYRAAQATYTKVLSLQPNSPSALFNRALLARILKHPKEERAGWLTYLSKYPAGDFAVKATSYLNLSGDFSYQIHNFGGQGIALPRVEFQALTTEITSTSLRTLNDVGRAAMKMKDSKLQVVVFQQNNKNLAKARAISIRQYLLEKFPTLTPERIGVSWFGAPEQTVIQGKTIRNPESVRFFFTGLK
jgi:tetratricopeptide (TPR) repeat protein